MKRQKTDLCSSFLLQFTNPGFCLPTLKSTLNLVYHVKKSDGREIFRNLIDCLEDWELEKIDF